jgi:hypothetical protein
MESSDTEGGFRVFYSGYGENQMAAALQNRYLERENVSPSLLSKQEASQKSSFQ